MALHHMWVMGIHAYTSIEFLKIWWKLIHAHYLPHHVETLLTFLFPSGLKPPTHIGFLFENPTTQYSLEFDMDAKDMNFQIKITINSKMKIKINKNYFLLSNHKAQNIQNYFWSKFLSGH
jgi:hypothetical protein